MKTGETILWSPEGGVAHLYVALNDSDHFGGRVVLINFTSPKGGQYAFTVPAHCHEFLWKESEVNFGDAIIACSNHVLGEIQSFNATEKAPLNIALVKEIALAAKTHPGCSREVQKMVAQAWPN